LFSWVCGIVESGKYYGCREEPTGFDTTGVAHSFTGISRLSDPDQRAGAAGWEAVIKKPGE
jgi:hypothetical protein